MKTEHTPGPWQIDPEDKWNVQGGPSGAVYTIATCWNVKGEGVANAQLVARAPDLLKACKAADSAFERNEPIGGLIWGEVRDLIRAAIKKTQEIL